MYINTLSFYHAFISNFFNKPLSHHKIIAHLMFCNNIMIY